MLSNIDTLRRGMVVRVRARAIEGSEVARGRFRLLDDPEQEEPLALILSLKITADDPFVVAVLLGKITERLAQDEVLISPPEGGVSLPAQVNLSKYDWLNKTSIKEIIGTLSDATMERVEKASRIASVMNKDY